mmetsp:Transcript_13576/g.54423  ORF Transcript_13576/g.54423 Transcript_13576/m.54423 type:complete len:280 (-) Transcript_13576:674-1513(-)
MDDDAGAFVGEAPRRRSADVASGARHDDHVIGRESLWDSGARSRQRAALRLLMSGGDPPSARKPPRSVEWSSARSRRRREPAPARSPRPVLRLRVAGIIIEDAIEDVVVEAMHGELELVIRPRRRPRDGAGSELLVGRDVVVLAHGEIPAIEVPLEIRAEVGQGDRRCRKQKAHLDVRAVDRRRQEPHPPRAVARHVELERREYRHEKGLVDKLRKRRRFSRKRHDTSVARHAHGVPVAGVRGDGRRGHVAERVAVHDTRVVRLRRIFHEELPIARDVI